MQGGVGFAIAGVPVRVLPTFFLMAAVLGFGYRDLFLIATWVALVFVSVLIHELGHAYVYRRSGSPASIVLHGFGGLTFGTSLPTGRELAASLAGPGVNLAVGVPLLALAASGAVTGSMAQTVLAMAVWVNVGWALLNLLPVLPLDGGHALVALLSLATRRDATRLVHVVSVGVAAVGAAIALRYGLLYAAVLGGVFAFLNMQALSRGPAWSVTRPVHRTVPRAEAGIHRAGDSSNPAVPPASSAPPAPTAPLSRPVAVPPPAAEPPAPAAPAAEEVRGERRPIAGRRTLNDEVGSAIKAILAGEPELALIAVDRVRAHGLSPEQAARADELEAWAWLQRGDRASADPVVQRLPADDPARPYLEAGLALVSGQVVAHLDDLANGDPASMSGQFLATLVTAG